MIKLPNYQLFISQDYDEGNSRFVFNLRLTLLYLQEMNEEDCIIYRRMELKAEMRIDSTEREDLKD